MNCIYCDDGLCNKVTNIARCTGEESDMARCPEWAIEFAAREIYNKLEDIRIMLGTELEGIKNRARY